MNQPAFTAIIVDDEEPARDLIKAYLKNFPQITLLAECANGFEALKAIQEHNPHILFLDVQMPKITGLELLEVLDNKPAVVFTTAFDQYAIRAFELSAVDYLLKPFSTERFNQAVEKVLARLQQNQPSPVKELLENFDQNGEQLNRIVVKSGSKMVVIPIADILFIEAQEDYVMIHTEKGRYMKQQTMGYYETHLPADTFVRIHRSYIANINRIERLEPYDKESYAAVIAPNHRLRASRTGYKKLRETLRF
jgi:two-component system LytT family response regulator